VAATEHPLTRADFDRCRWEEVIAGSKEKECFAYACLFFGRLKQARDAGDEVAAAIFRRKACGNLPETALSEVEWFPRLTTHLLRGYAHGRYRTIV
jgi:hypothetical protein